MRSFRRRELFPAHVEFMTEDAVCWQRPATTITIEPLAFRNLRFDGDPALPADAGRARAAGARARRLRQCAGQREAVSPDRAGRAAARRGRVCGAAAGRVGAHGAPRHPRRAHRLRPRRGGHSERHGACRRRAQRLRGRLYHRRRPAGRGALRDLQADRERRSTQTADGGDQGAAEGILGTGAGGQRSAALRRRARLQSCVIARSAESCGDCTRAATTRPARRRIPGRRRCPECAASDPRPRGSQARRIRRSAARPPCAAPGVDCSSLSGTPRALDS